MNCVRVVAVVAITSSLATAIPVDVGTGDNSAGLYIEWSDGYIAEFIINFEDETITGLGMFDVVEAETTLTTVREDYGWGIFIDGITYDNHSNIGFGGGDDWWHFWIKDGDQDWLSPGYGVADRVLYDGDMDGWIYGRAGPVPEPSMIALLGLGALLLRKRRA